MKKIFLLSLFVLIIKGYGQTYTMELLFKKPNIAYNEISWYLNYFIGDNNNKNGIVSEFDKKNTTVDEKTTTIYTYSLKDFNGLEDGGEYQIRYQAYPNRGGKGFFISLKKENFTYKEPTPLTFSLAETNPLCNNTDGKVTINVSGGTLPYNYILDNETEVINGETFPKKNIFSGTSTIVTLTPVPHNIKVTDTNGCFDKTAKQ